MRAFRLSSVLREDTRDLNSQFAALAVQLVEMALLIQQLQENSGMSPSIADKNGWEHDHLR